MMPGMNRIPQKGQASTDDIAQEACEQDETRGPRKFERLDTHRDSQEMHVENEVEQGLGQVRRDQHAPHRVVQAQA